MPVKILVHKGDWAETFARLGEELVVVVDDSGQYSRHSGFVQAVRRYLGGDYRVWSRKRVCHVAMTLRSADDTSSDG